MQPRSKRFLFDGLAIAFLIIAGALFTTPWDNFFKRPGTDKLNAETAWIPAVLDIQHELTLLQRDAVRENDSRATTGRRIFFDPQFSANGRVSCATCHAPERAFTDGKALPIGVSVGARHAPTLLNAAYSPWLFWDGRATNLASQALGPIENPLEHGFTRLAAVRLTLQKYPDLIPEPDRTMLQDWFAAHPHAEAAPPTTRLVLNPYLATLAVASMDRLVWHHSILQQAARLGQSPGTFFSETIAGPKARPSSLPKFIAMAIDNAFLQVGEAIAAYVATLRDFSTPFDTFVSHFREEKAPEDAFTEGFGADELEGLKLFYGKASCATCHRGARFTDDSFHNIGIADAPKDWQQIDLGRAQGILAAKANSFNCSGTNASSESCLELPYIDEQNPETLGAFKTPTLRFLVQTAPYMHNGSLPSLEAVLAHYQALPEQTMIGHRTESLKSLRLSASEQKNLLAFLHSLSPKQWPH